MLAEKAEAVQKSVDEAAKLVEDLTGEKRAKVRIRFVLWFLTNQASLLILGRAIGSVEVRACGAPETVRSRREETPSKES